MNQYDKLKTKLHEYKVDIDKDMLWKNTSHAIPKRKRRPVILIMLFAGLVFSGWLLHSTSLLPFSKSSSAIHSHPDKNPDQLVQNLQNIESSNPFEVADSPAKTVKTLATKLYDSPAKFISSTNSVEPDHESKANTRTEKIISINTKEQNESIVIPGLTANNKQNKKSKTLKNSTEAGNIEKQNIQSVEKLNPQQNEESFALLDSAENNLTNTFITNVPVDYLSKAISQIPKSISAVTVPRTEAKIEPLKSEFLQSIQIAQDIGFSTMKIQSLTSETAEFAAELQQKMRSLEILSTTATATINLPKGFTLETGLKWNRLTTVIDHDWDSSERISQEGITTIIIDENGIPQSVTGNTDITRISHHHATQYTEHQNLDFVLGLHKLILDARRFSVLVFVNGAYNLVYQSKGTTLTKNREFIGFAQKDTPYNRISPFTIGGGLQLQFQLRPHWNISGRIVFDHQGYQYKDPALPVQFLHSGFSSGLGLGYTF